MKKTALLCISFFLCFVLRTKASAISNSINAIETTLNVNIVHDSIIKDSWAAVTYNLPADSAFLLQYLQWLHREYLKYPEGYFQRAGIKTIALCTDLHYDGQNRAGVPDAYKNTLYFAVDGAYDDSTETYLVHVMHHELHHCTEYALWNDMYFRWKDWKKSNPCFFRYKGSGAKAYENLSINWYSMAHPRKGFVNLYSTTAQEEDRSEVVALIFSDIERDFLFQFSKKDKKLRRKISLTIEMLNKISGTTENYWTDVMKDRNP